MYDYGARFYDASLGRFSAQDRFSEKYFDLSPYQYAANNPIILLDLNGDSIVYSNNVSAEQQQILTNYYNNLSGNSSAFSQLYQNLANSTETYTIDIDANLDSGRPGKFVPATNTIKFLSIATATNNDTPVEEIFHAFQTDNSLGDYGNVPGSNKEVEAALFKVLVFSELTENGQKMSPFINDVLQPSIDNAIIFDSPISNNGNVNLSSQNLQSADFLNFYRSALNDFSNNVRALPNMPAGYRQAPSNRLPQALIRIQTQLGR